MIKQFTESPIKGCFFVLFEITSFASNIFTLFGGLREVNEITYELGVSPIHWNQSPWVSGFLLFYGLLGLSAFVWSFATDRIVGAFRANVYAVILYLIPGTFIIYSYADTFHHERVAEFFLSPTLIIFFLFAPILVGRVIVDAFIAPSWSSRDNF